MPEKLSWKAASHAALMGVMNTSLSPKMLNGGEVKTLGKTDKQEYLLDREFLLEASYRRNVQLIESLTEKEWLELQKEIYSYGTKQIALEKENSVLEKAQQLAEQFGGDVEEWKQTILSQLK